jgi:hypothetical protein
MNNINPPTPQLGGLKRLPVLKVPHMGDLGGGFKRRFKGLLKKEYQ